MTALAMANQLRHGPHNRFERHVPPDLVRFVKLGDAAAAVLCCVADDVGHGRRSRWHLGCKFGLKSNVPPEQSQTVCIYTPKDMQMYNYTCAIKCDGDLAIKLSFQT